MASNFALKTIKDFLKNPSKKGSKRNQWASHICTLTQDLKFNWNNYTYDEEFNQLSDEQMTIHDVAKWLLIFLFKKSKQNEPEIDYTVSFQKAIKVLRDNRHLPELRPLLQFLSTFQEKRLEICKIPLWFELAIVPLCLEISITISPKPVELSIKNGFQLAKSFWINLIEALSFQYIPYWLNTSDYICNFLLFQLLQNFSETNKLIESFLSDKPEEYFNLMQADLLVYLAHYNFLTKAQIQNILFNNSRRKTITTFKMVWLYDSFSKDSIIHSFLLEEFKSFYDFSLIKNCITLSGINKFDFNFMFKHPGYFFVTLLGKSETLNESSISVNEMEKFLHLFCWNTHSFLSFLNHEVFVIEFMKLRPDWRNLLIQLFRFEKNILIDTLIFNFAKTVLKIKNVNFDMDLFNLCSIYMKNIVMNSSREAQKYFLDWLINHAEIRIFAHFPLTPELTQIANNSFSDITSKRKIFWSLFLTKCVENYLKNDSRMIIDMGQVCQEFGFQMSTNLIAQTITKFNETINCLYNLFGIISLSLYYSDKYVIHFNFPSIDSISTILPLETLHPFRQLVIKIKSFMNYYREKQQIESPLINMINFIRTNQEFIQQLCQHDQNFLKGVFNSYLPNLILSNELINGLLDIANLLPCNLKQIMIEACPILRILENKRKRISKEAESQTGKKMRIDLCDPVSYECECSGCGKFFLLSEISCSKKYGDTSCLSCLLTIDKYNVPMNMTLISFSEIDA